MKKSNGSAFFGFATYTKGFPHEKYKEVHPLFDKKIDIEDIEIVKDDNYFCIQNKMGGAKHWFSISNEKLENKWVELINNLKK